MNTLKDFPKPKRINKWIEEHGPNGVAKLALEVGVSVSTVIKARNDQPPKKISTQKKFVNFFREANGDAA